MRSTAKQAAFGKTAVYKGDKVELPLSCKLIYSFIQSLIDTRFCGGSIPSKLMKVSFGNIHTEIKFIINEYNYIDGVVGERL